MFDTLRFDTDEYGFIRLDKNCTPGKTIPCGNACRKPDNCKQRGGAMAKPSSSRSQAGQKAAATRALNKRTQQEISRLPQGRSPRTRLDPVEQAIAERALARRKNKKGYVAKPGEAYTTNYTRGQRQVFSDVYSTPERVSNLRAEAEREGKRMEREYNRQQKQRATTSGTSTAKKTTRSRKKA